MHVSARADPSLSQPSTSSCECQEDWGAPLLQGVLERREIQKRDDGAGGLLQRIDVDSGSQQQKQQHQSVDSAEHYCLEMYPLDLRSTNFDRNDQ